MVIFPLAPDQTIAQMWSNGARGAIGIVHSEQNSECLSGTTSRAAGRWESRTVLNMTS